jgi:hypothetical protein
VFGRAADEIAILFRRRIPILIGPILIGPILIGPILIGEAVKAGRARALGSEPPILPSFEESP